MAAGGVQLVPQLLVAHQHNVGLVHRHALAICGEALDGPHWGPAGEVHLRAA